MGEPPCHRALRECGCAVETFGARRKKAGVLLSLGEGAGDTHPRGVGVLGYPIIGIKKNLTHFYVKKIPALARTSRGRGVWNPPPPPAPGWGGPTCKKKKHRWRVAVCEKDGDEHRRNPSRSILGGEVSMKAWSNGEKDG